MTEELDWRSEEMNQQKLFYHYCTVEAMQSILEHRCLRLTDVEKSNDYAERRWMQEQISSAILKNARELTCEEAYRFGREFEEARACYKPDTILYASCFSEQKDLLSQWRAYAMDGRGVAIGLYSSALEATADGENPLCLTHICYEKKMQEKFAKSRACALLDAWRMGKEILPEWAKICRDPMMELGIMKNPAFSEEQEWRLCMAVPSGYEGIQIYYNNYRLISYREFQLPKDDALTVGQIVLGPKCRLEERDVELCLQIWGYPQKSVEVLRSAATYC